MAGILIVSGRQTLGQFEGGESSAQAGRRLVSAYLASLMRWQIPLRVFSAISAVRLLFADFER